MRDDTAELVSGVESAGLPDAQNGERLATALRRGADRMRGRFDAARKEAEALPTTTPQEFLNSQGEFLEVLNEAAQGLGDELESIESGEVQTAFEEQKACQG